MKRVLLLISVAALSSCATRPKIYQAPDDSKVAAATADLNTKVTKARDTAAKAKVSTEEAQKHGQILIDLGKTTGEKIETLRLKLPLEWQPLANEVKSSFDLQMSEEGIVRDKLGIAVGWNTQLDGQLKDAEKARATLQSEQGNYAGAAASLAKTATDERDARIKDEKALSWYRWHFYLTWFIAGAGLLVCIVLAFLKFTGRLALSGASIASKIP